MLYLQTFWSLKTTTFINDSAVRVIVKYILAVTCGSLSISHGSVFYNKSPVIDGKCAVGTKAIFSCNYGYKHSGDKTRTCRTSGKWSKKKKPKCTQSKQISISNWF